MAYTAPPKHAPTLAGSSQDGSPRLSSPPALCVTGPAGGAALVVDDEYHVGMIRTSAAAVALLFALVVPAAAAPPKTITGKVVSVHDGDTLTFRTDDEQTLKVRLQGIDAPELGQPFGRRSRDELVEVAKGKAATLIEHGRDKYGRTLGAVIVAGVDANARQVAAGMAWHYERFDKSPGLARAQADARAARRGLWSDPAPVAPWDWRAAEQARRKAKKGSPAGAASP